jgi:multidrug efflux system outer membrane protein
MNGLGSRELREIDLYSAGFDATWELDIFGRVRRGVESNDAEIERAVAERRDLLVIVSAEVARTYVELRGTQGRLAVARRNAQNQRDTLEVVDSRVRGGTANELDLARARAQLASTVAQIPGLEATAARAIHRLGVLVGEPPTALVRELSAPRPIPTLPPVLQIGDPGALVQRRADIRAADHALHAATARVGVAKADFFPRVSFNGRVALEANVLKDLGKAGNESYAFGPSISWAAFDMGRVNAYYQAAGARAEAAHARYRQTVLLALEDVESSLVTFGRERTRRELLREAASANETAAELARERYRNGLADFLTVLDAERRVLESDDQLAEGETRTASALVAVYKALGGGWQ